MHSEQIDKLTQALVEAGNEFKTIELNAKAHFGRYADLRSVFDACKPALYKHGLKILHTIEQEEGACFVTCYLLHSSGQWIKSRVPMSVGNKKPTEVGGWITYMRRYTAVAILGVAAEEEAEGDELNSTAPNPAGACEGDRNALIELMASHHQLKSVWKKIAEKYGSHLERIEEHQIEGVRRYIEEKIEQAQGTAS